MLPKRYSFVVAERSSGVVRRFTLAVRPTLAVVAAILAVPLAWTGHARWTAGSQIERLQLQNAVLEVENARYRSATTELSGRIAALQLVVGELRDRSALDPRIRRAMNRLPDTDPADGAAALRAVALSSPVETFNLLDDLLSVLDVQLSLAGDTITQQQAIAAATPINLPANGSVSGRYGYRVDPFSGKRAFHPAVDISTGYGAPVYATADGRVESAERSGAYGNLVEIDHGFGLVTRYGHLQKFKISSGARVRRGDVVGYAGHTGRATGTHVHYEVWVNGRAMNPLQLGNEPRSQSAN